MATSNNQLKIFLKIEQSAFVSWNTTGFNLPVWT